MNDELQRILEMYQQGDQNLSQFQPQETFRQDLFSGSQPQQSGQDELEALRQSAAASSAQMANQGLSQSQGLAAQSNSATQAALQNRMAQSQQAASQMAAQDQQQQQKNAQMLMKIAMMFMGA